MHQLAPSLTNECNIQKQTTCKNHALMKNNKILKGISIIANSSIKECVKNGIKSACLNARIVSIYYTFRLFRPVSNNL